MTPDLTAFRWIVVNSSGGKDSQTALRQVVLMADAQGVPRDRIVVSHQCLGRIEWPGTVELVHRQADAYGLRVIVAKYRNRDGEEIDLLEYVQRRGMWPSSKNRFCTSEFKRAPGGRVLTILAQVAAGPILNVYGFRAEESLARRLKKPWITNPRFSTGKKPVTDWLPIHGWTEAQVWADIRESGVPYARAYDLGARRYSCPLCIFGTEADLMIAGRELPDLLTDYVRTEQTTGHRFRQDLSLEDLQKKIAAT